MLTQGAHNNITWYKSATPLKQQYVEEYNKESDL